MFEATELNHRNRQTEWLVKVLLLLTLRCQLLVVTTMYSLSFSQLKVHLQLLVLKVWIKSSSTLSLLK